MSPLMCFSSSQTVKKQSWKQGRIQGEVIGAMAPLKPKKVILFIMILYNSENNIRDIRPFCRPLLCHSHVVKSQPCWEL